MFRVSWKKNSQMVYTTNNNMLSFFLNPGISLFHQSLVFSFRMLETRCAVWCKQIDHLSLLYFMDAVLFTCIGNPLEIHKNQLTVALYNGNIDIYTCAKRPKPILRGHHVEATRMFGQIRVIQLTQNLHVEGRNKYTYLP